MFHFKQFSIAQDQCAMKITSDACVLGAYAKIEGAKKVLDIGTGTGLLALMCAQRNPNATFDAVEIDQKAYLQASQNFKGSPFHSQISAHHSSIQEFEPAHQYDLIISNPPFFNNSILSSNKERAVARHASSLTHKELLLAISTHLTHNGIAQLLLPQREMDALVIEAKQLGLFPVDELKIIPHPQKANSKKAIFKVITTFSKSRQATCTSHTLFVYQLLYPKNRAEDYTEEFANLLRHYFLIF